MARILAISSQVARGAIGLSAIVPALQMLGHEVVALPTILLSCHPGHARFAGERIDPDLLFRMLDALDGNGWMAEIDAVLTGYLPSATHVALAEDAVRRLQRQRPDALYICDPVLGDEPKGLYIAEEAACAIRERLLPIADAITPNRFEASFLSGRPVMTAGDAAAAMAVGDRDPLAVVKSLPGANGTLLNVASRAGHLLAAARVQRRSGAQHGTGDLMSALVLAALVEKRWSPAETLALATSILDGTLEQSAGRDELCLTGLPRRFDDVNPWRIERQEPGGTATPAAFAP
jgi:pyridoxine kinase